MLLIGVGCVGVGASGSCGGCSLVGEVVIGASCARWSVWAAPLGALRPALVVAAFAVFWLAVCLAALAEPLIVWSVLELAPAAVGALNLRRLAGVRWCMVIEALAVLRAGPVCVAGCFASLGALCSWAK